VDEVIQLSSPKDRNTACVLKKSIAADVPPLRGDPEQLRQVLLNLIVNSMQASPNGGQIEISADVEDEQLIIKVKDDGPGIAAQAVDKIFEPFFSTHDRSLGLGLSTALRIVTEHGGSIALDRNQHEGTCISVKLPLSPSPPTMM